jgi:hypothetical protein
MAGGQTTLQDLGAEAAPFSLGATKSFGVQVASSITGAFSIHVEARDASGAVLGQGDGSTTLSPGNRLDVRVTLAPPVPVIVSEPVYIGSGGTAASAAQQLSLNTGGSDTHGAGIAASGAVFTPGFFATQSY